MLCMLGEEEYRLLKSELNMSAFLYVFLISYTRNNPVMHRFIPTFRNTLARI
jgi:hypothetical protein